MTIDKCLVCDSTELTTYLNLGDQPLANSYHKGEQLPRFPLALNLCAKCNHHQLTYSVDPKLMFEHYLYVSDTSKTLNEYFAWLKDYIGSPQSVLELACNSGCLLERFHKDPACEIVLGVDPAKNLKALAEAKGLKVLDTFWNLETARSLDQKFEAVIAVNVLPHVPDPVGFLQACKEVCSGKIYIQTSHCDIFEKGEWDTVYHEHISYFTASSFQALAKKVGLVITKAQKVPIHSNSFLFTLENPDLRWEARWQDPTVEQWKEDESSFDAHDFGKRIEESKFNLSDRIALHCMADDLKLVAYGASAKGNTALNFFQVKPEYIVDDNPMKWGYMTPGMDVPVVSPERLAADPADLCILMTAWNFAAEISAKIRKLRPNNKDMLVYYVPEIYTTSLHPLCG